MGKSERALADITHWIGGQRVAGASARSGKVFNPATGDITGSVRFADTTVVDAAVRAALGCIARMERDIAVQSGTRDVSLQGPDGAQS